MHNEDNKLSFEEILEILNETKQPIQESNPFAEKVSIILSYQNDNDAENSKSDKILDSAD